jgi:ribosomal subunit interface protein
MKISISGQYISIGNSLQDYVKSCTIQAAQTYFSAAISTSLHFSKHLFQLVCDIAVTDDTGRHVIMKCNAASDDIFSA